MTKVQKNYWVDMVLLIAGLICVISGYLLDFHIGARAYTKLYKDIHSYSAYVMTAALVLHFYYHWSWLKEVSKRQLLSKQE